MRNYWDTFKGWSRTEKAATVIVSALILIAAGNLPLTKALMVNQQSYSCEQLVKFRAGLYTEDTEILATSVTQLDAHYAEWNTAYDTVNADSAQWGAGYTHSQVVSGNPHNVTSSDVGADTTITKVNTDSDKWDTAYTHTLSTSNPHSVTKAQVGLTSVEDSALSTWAGSTNITTLGTIATGSIPAGKIDSGNLDPARMPTSGTWDPTDTLHILGTIRIGTGDAAASMSPLEIVGSDGGLAITSTDTAPTTEAYTAGFIHDAGGTYRKLGATAWQWADSNVTDGWASWNTHTTAFTAGITSDYYGLAVWAKHGAAFFPTDVASTSAPGADILRVNGAFETTGGATITSDLAVDSPTLCVNASANTVCVGKSTSVAGAKLTVSQSYDGSGGAYIENTSTGTSAVSSTKYKNTGSTTAYSGLCGSARSTYGSIGADVMVACYTDSAAGATMMVDAVGPITLATNALTRLTVESAGNVVVTNYTKLGSAAPAIKMVEITGTTAGSEGATAQAAHGVTSSKIISATALVFSDANTGWTPSCTLGEFGTSGYGYCLNFDGTNVFITNHPTESENILSKAFVVTIFYKE